MDDNLETPWGLLTTRADGTIVEVNQRLALWAARPRELLCAGLRWQHLLTPASRILYETHFVPRLEAQGSVSEVSLDLAREDGSRFPIIVSALRQDGTAGEPGSVSITVFDATQTRRFEQVLREARRDAEDANEALALSHKSLRTEHERLRVMLRSIGDAVMTTDALGCITSFNPTAEEVTGVSAAQAIGAPVGAYVQLLLAESRHELNLVGLLSQLTGRRSSDLILVRPDGTERYLEGTLAPIRDEAERVDGAVFVWRDMTQKRADAAARHFEATHDMLTGLLNRREFERQVGIALSAVGGADAAPNLLVHIDLDQFKIINDTAGSTVADELLAALAGSLRQILRQSDVLARIGGDEFGVLLTRCPVKRGAAVADLLRCRIEDFRFEIGTFAHAVTASVGLAVLAERDGTADSALASAAMACQAAKDAGRNRVHFVEAEDADMLQRREEMGWVSRIRLDLSEERFELFFQPIVRVDSLPEVLRHGELLLRLRDADGYLVPPGSFIAAAERYHQMAHIDRWVVSHAFDWLDTQPAVQVSINVSGQSFGDPTFLTYVMEQMADRRFDPAHVCFEITETAAIANLPAALSFIASLRERGCLFSLDDFGAGLSSFGYLRTLPVDFVKIDGSFVKTMVSDPVNRAIVESIHRVASLCGMKTVAEWVEDAADLVALRAIGVDFAQGWAVGKPMPLSEVQLS